MQHSFQYRKMDEEVMACLNEAMLPSFQKGFTSGYEQQKGMEDAAYAKYADVAKKALEKSQNFAAAVEKKTGLSPALTISLVAAGITGGASAIPMGALMYFARKYYTKGLAKVVDVGVDAVANTAQKVMGTKPQLQPEWADVTFKEWLAYMEEKQGWLDWGAEKLGRVAGRVSGAVAGLVGNIANTIASRLKELGSFISKNPRQAAKIALTIGLAAATGGMVGKLSKDIVNAVGDKIHELMPNVNHQDLAAAQDAIVPGSASAEAGAQASQDVSASVAQKLSNMFKDDQPISTQFISDNPTTAGELQQSVESLMQKYELVKQKQEKIKQVMDAIDKAIEKGTGVPEFDNASPFSVADTYSKAASLTKPIVNAAGEIEQYGFNPSGLYPSDHYNSLETLKQTIEKSLEQKTAALEAMKSGAKAAY